MAATNDQLDFRRGFYVDTEEIKIYMPQTLVIMCHSKLGINTNKMMREFILSIPETDLSLMEDKKTHLVLDSATDYIDDCKDLGPIFWTKLEA